MIYFIFLIVIFLILSYINRQATNFIEILHSKVNHDSLKVIGNAILKEKCVIWYTDACKLFNILPSALLSVLKPYFVIGNCRADFVIGICIPNFLIGNYRSDFVIGNCLPNFLTGNCRSDFVIGNCLPNFLIDNCRADFVIGNYLADF